MRIVIDIPDEYYNQIMKSKDNIVIKNIVYACIESGKLLPKGHGRLLILSEDAVKREQTPLTLNFSCQKWISEVGLSNATVAIIEAESEVEHAEALRSSEESSSADA